MQSPWGQLHDSAVEIRLLMHLRVCKQAYLVAHLLHQEVHAVRLLLTLHLLLLLGILPQLSALRCQARPGLHQAHYLHQTNLP